MESRAGSLSTESSEVIAASTHQWRNYVARFAISAGIPSFWLHRALVLAVGLRARILAEIAIRLLWCSPGRC